MVGGVSDGHPVTASLTFPKLLLEIARQIGHLRD
jgi:hypothetical protein